MNAPATLDTAALRQHAALVLHHLTKAEGIRESGADASGEMAEAKRHLTECANHFGMFVDPIEEAPGKPTLDELQDLRSRFYDLGGSTTATYWLLSAVISIEHLGYSKSGVMPNINRAVERLGRDAPPDTEGMCRATETKLWNLVNAEGGVPTNEYERGFNDAIGKALELIEASGHAEMLEALKSSREALADLAREVDAASWIDDDFYRDAGPLAVIDAAMAKATADTAAKVSVEGVMAGHDVMVAALREAK